PRLAPLTVLDLPVRDCYRSASWSFSGRRVPSARTPDEAVYLPGRNLLLLAKAAVFCAERRIPSVALGSLGSNPFPDGNPSFFRRMAATASAGLGFRLAISAPFARSHKARVIADAEAVPWESTFSCIAPRGSRHCGRCNKCAERRAAFREAGVPDPTPYSVSAGAARGARPARRGARR
ncbi:MAG: 7-cyano-7-deazaguanine synthase, partial [Elusimicrobia bacterium]|nr:7-cyano-7-deazaguanine synthase [Elusimicrobiota bacterium]